MKECVIQINADSNEENAKKEQYRIYQLDGQTYQVPVGIMATVPEWVAIRAKQIGDIKDFIYK